MAIERVAIVGLGLIGSSIARAIKERLPQVAVTGHDASEDVRGVARALGFATQLPTIPPRLWPMPTSSSSRCPSGAWPTRRRRSRRG